MNPTPQRQRVVVFPTPNVDDLLFYELVDNHRVGEKNVPDYGTAHPDAAKWPDHRLIHIKAHDDEGKMWRYYYAADQLEQDDDNWSSSQADIGGTKFDSVVREYVTRRSEYDFDSPAQGDVMPSVPAGKFTDTYILSERKQTPINDEVLNGLYIVEQRTYIKRETITIIEADSIFGVGGRSVDTLYYRGEVVTGGTTVESLFATDDHAYWGWDDDGNERSGQQLSDNWFLIREKEGFNSTIEAYKYSYPSTTSVSIPRILTGAQVDWAESAANGEQNSSWSGFTASSGFGGRSLAGSPADSSSSSASIQPSISFSFREVDGSKLPTTVYVFYVKDPVTTSSIISTLAARFSVNAGAWPGFETTSFSVTLIGGAADVRASVTAGVSLSTGSTSYSFKEQSSDSTHYSVRTNRKTVSVSGVIVEGGISNGGSREVTVEANAEMDTGISGSFPAPLSASAAANASHTVTGSVTTAGGGSESGSAPAAGDYIMQTSIRPYRYKYSLAVVEVLHWDGI